MTLGNPEGDRTLSQKAYWQILHRELQAVGTRNSSFNKRQNDWHEVMAAMRDKKELYCKVMFVDREDEA